MGSGRRPSRVFLLSPAHAGGLRAALLLRAGASFPLAVAVQSGPGAPLGEVYRFVSGLYFRGKLAYAEAFARPPRGSAGALVIVPGAGLVDARARVDARDLRAFGSVPVDPGDPRYAEPLARDAADLARALGEAGEAVLLGSVASDKYVRVLAPILRERLVFPPDFVGRGDMSRGGLLLRAARAGAELRYAPVEGAVVHGTRPPRLAPIRRPASGRPRSLRPRG